MERKKDDAINDAEFTGNILLLLREAIAFVKANTRKGWEKLPDGRKNEPEYAERAVLEALVNHFIHRDYTVMGSEVHLDIYDDRLAITSPGGVYSGQKVLKSTTSQFMTTIYSMEYEPKDQQIEHNQVGIKQGLSWEQVGTKTGLSWDEVAKLFNDICFE